MKMTPKSSHGVSDQPDDAAPVLPFLAPGGVNRVLVPPVKAKTGKSGKTGRTGKTGKTQ